MHRLHHPRALPCLASSALNTDGRPSWARIVAALWVSALLAACHAPSEPGARGTLEYPRIDYRADSSETLLELSVQEGDAVQPGTPIARLDDRRARALLAAAEAQARAAELRVEELVKGARSETLRAARAEHAAAVALRDEAERERGRAAELAAQGLIPQAELDRRQTQLQQAVASLNGARARLDELLAGTRDEQLRQAQQQWLAARAELELQQINLQRLTLVASEAGRIETLPFEVGERLPAGSVLASQLVGTQPYARVFLPLAERAAARPGDRYQVLLRGRAEVWPGRLRWIASEPAFTPYYALSGEDADRLVYLAEIDLLEAERAQLPAGLPLRVLPVPENAGP